MKNFSLTILILLAGLNCADTLTAEAPARERTPTPAPATFTCGRVVKFGICALLAGSLSKLLETGPSVGRLSSIPPKDCCCFPRVIFNTHAIPVGSGYATIEVGTNIIDYKDYTCTHPECTRFCYPVVTPTADFQTSDDF